MADKVTVVKIEYDTKEAVKNVNELTSAVEDQKVEQAKLKDQMEKGKISQTQYATEVAKSKETQSQYRKEGNYKAFGIREG